LAVKAETISGARLAMDSEFSTISAMNKAAAMGVL
jgi:hypothetical protein